MLSLVLYFCCNNKHVFTSKENIARRKDLTPEAIFEKGKQLATKLLQVRDCSIITGFLLCNHGILRRSLSS